jgi:hypothetical protein
VFKPIRLPSGPTDGPVARRSIVSLHDDGPKGFVKNLMNKNPAHRPSFIDRSAERLDTTPCDDGDMVYVDEEGGNKESKAQAKNDVGINHDEPENRKRQRIDV